MLLQRCLDLIMEPPEFVWKAALTHMFRIYPQINVNCTVNLQIDLI